MSPIVGPDKGLGFRVERLWVALAVHEDGDEAVPAVYTSQGWMPLVAADPERLETFVRPAAQQMAKEHGREIKIVEFSTLKIVDVYGPKS